MTEAIAVGAPERGIRKAELDRPRAWLAAGWFGLSAISIPLLLDRPQAHVVSAIAASFQAILQNPTTMAFWAVLIVLFVGAGLITFHVGLIVTPLLIGHASWHGYRDLVE
jgi:uncharacterized membrane protein